MVGAEQHASMRLIHEGAALEDPLFNQRVSWLLMRVVREHMAITPTQMRQLGRSPSAQR